MPESVKHKNIEIKETQLIRDISIWLDDYDDIFSDFDPRPYSERILSDDFIAEATKLSRESEFRINELRLLLPEKTRDQEKENIIIKRLHNYFHKSFQLAIDERKSIIKKGILVFIIGTFLMALSTYISGVRTESIVNNILFVVLEPAGWFLVWMGLDNMFYLLKKKKRDLDFYTKMGKTKVKFISI